MKVDMMAYVRVDEMVVLEAAATVVYMAGMKASALAGAKVAQ